MGRGIQAFSMIDKMSPEAISLSVAGKIRRYNLTASRKIAELTGKQQKSLSGLVNKIVRTPVGRQRNILIAKLEKQMADMIPSTLGEKAITVWKAGLLTSLRTSERNLLGTSFQTGAEFAKDIVQSPLDIIMKARTGQRTMVTTPKGIVPGAKKGFQSAWDLIRYGVDPEEMATKFDVRRINWGKTKTGKALEFSTNVVFRNLAAQDQVFYKMTFEHSIQSSLGAASKNAGRKVTEITQDMLEQATKDALYATFKDKTKLAQIATAAKKAMGKRLKSDDAYAQFYNNTFSGLLKGAGEVAMPFTGVPSSILSKIVDYSPIGLLKGTTKVGIVLAKNVPSLQLQAGKEMARGVIGTGIFSISAWLAKKGLMTGQAKDKAERNQWELEGKKPNSIFILGKWRNINSVGPQTMVMLAGAKAQQELMSEDGGGIGAFGGAIGQDFLSQSLLAGVQGPLNAVSDPQRYGGTYLKSQLASVIPNILKDLAKSLDPLKRERYGLTDAFRAGVPGLSQTLPPQRDVLGEALINDQHGITAFFDLFNSSTPKTSIVVDELKRLREIGYNPTPSELGKTQSVAGVQLDLKPLELDILRKESGGILEGLLTILMTTPEYEQATDDERSDLIKSTTSYVRTNYKKLHLNRFTDVQTVLDALKRKQEEK